MGFEVIIRLQLLQKTKRKQLSHAHLVLLHIDACHLVFAMHHLHSKGGWLAFFLEYVENIIQVFMDDFSVYGDSFDRCLENLALVLKRCLTFYKVLCFVGDLEDNGGYGA